jgi:probable HAF family extracellular repeat protein
MPVATVSPAANGSSIVVIIQGGTFAHGINDAGQIAGYSYSIVFVPKTIYGKVTGFLYSNGSFTTIDDPSSISSQFSPDPARPGHSWMPRPISSCKRWQASAAAARPKCPMLSCPTCHSHLRRHRSSVAAARR